MLYVCVKPQHKNQTEIRKLKQTETHSVIRETVLVVLQAVTDSYITVILSQPGAPYRGLPVSYYMQTSECRMSLLHIGESSCTCPMF